MLRIDAPMVQRSVIYDDNYKDRLTLICCANPTEVHV